MTPNPILQFGSSRFLLAHVDLFVSQAMERGEALGGITLVQSTGHATSLARVAALADGAGYPVRVRGMLAGVERDETLTGHAVKAALSADAQWAQVVEAVASHVRVIVSNTGDSGYALNPADDASLLGDPQRAPRSFPAKMLMVLHARWQRQPTAALSIFPCELISHNGDTLRDLVIGLARSWALPAGFEAYLRSPCIWANSLVDRIVSEPLHPVGAVAEPYALWAIEKQPGLVLPCTHESIVLTDNLQLYERLKLYLLNLGHTCLAERWLAAQPAKGLAADLTVFQAMNDAALRAGLEGIWLDEVVPVFEALGLGQAARDYIVDLRDRLLNPFLVHRLADIAQNHLQKKQRRFQPVIALAEELVPGLAQPRLRQMLGSPVGA